MIMCEQGALFMTIDVLCVSNSYHDN